MIFWSLAMATSSVAVIPGHRHELIENAALFREPRPPVPLPHEVPAWTEMAVEDRMRGKDPLRLGGRLDALYLALASSSRLMRVLGAIIQIPARPMPDIGQDLALRHPVTA